MQGNIKTLVVGGCDTLDQLAKIAASRADDIERGLIGEVISISHSSYGLLLGTTLLTKWTAVITFREEIK